MSRQLIATDVERRSAAWYWSTGRVLPVVGGNFLVGLSIAAFAPAVFWTLVVKGASWLLGLSIGWLGLAIVGGVIFAFLATIYTCFARNV